VRTKYRGIAYIRYLQKTALTLLEDEKNDDMHVGPGLKWTDGLLPALPCPDSARIGPGLQHNNGTSTEHGHPAIRYKLR
jgi:hypothetical protein